MTKSSDIISLLSKPYTGTQRGGALFHAMQARRQPQTATRAQREFFDEMRNARTARPAEPYNHPARGPRDLRPEGPLSQTELMWLERLPRDPTKVTFDDAQALANLSQSFAGSMDHRDARRLVESIWGPVRELHDRAAAEVELRNAERPDMTVPSTAGNALADAIAAENPNLTPAEVVGRVSAALDNAAASRTAERDQAILSAKTKLADLNDAASRRTETLRTNA